jgi:hypothetical protein
MCFTGGGVGCRIVLPGQPVRWLCNTVAPSDHYSVSRALIPVTPSLRAVNPNVLYRRWGRLLHRATRSTCALISYLDVGADPTTLSAVLPSQSRPLCELCTQMCFTGGGVSCCIVLPGQPVRWPCNTTALPTTTLSAVLRPSHALSASCVPKCTLQEVGSAVALCYQVNLCVDLVTQLAADPTTLSAVLPAQSRPLARAVLYRAIRSRKTHLQLTLNT